MEKLYRHVANIQGSYLQKTKKRKKMVFKVSYSRNKFSVPLFDAILNSDFQAI